MLKTRLAEFSFAIAVFLPTKVIGGAICQEFAAFAEKQSCPATKSATVTVKLPALTMQTFRR